MENVNNKEKNLLEEFEKIQSNPISHAIFWSQVLKTNGSKFQFYISLIKSSVKVAYSKTTEVKSTSFKDIHTQ